MAKLLFYWRQRMTDASIDAFWFIIMLLNVDLQRSGSLKD